MKLLARSPFIMLFLSFSTVAFCQTADIVHGNLIQFNDNGTWSWYQDERAAVDAGGGKLIVGSNANRTGVGGQPRNGDIEAVIFDLETRTGERYTLMEGGANFGGSDDHNAPAFLVRPDGKYLAMYAGHNNNNFSYYRIFDGDGWGEEGAFDWDEEVPGGVDFATTYSNLFYLSEEDLTINIARTYNRSPNLMISEDLGETWTYGGLLTEPDESIGYVNGYFKYAGNGKDRIDFVATEHHPRDFNTSIFHGFIQNGQTFKADGGILDNDIYDQSAPQVAEFTPVFRADTVVNGITMTRAWTMELAAYDDGTLATIFKARANDDEFDHRFFYARYDGENWTTTYLGMAGEKMYFSEEDYVGLGALHPNDPNVLYISTNYDPRDDSSLGVREIFKGATTDNGATWNWTPVTENSTRDNFRPIIPAWDEDHTALIWWRGTYNTAQIFDAAVVGIIESEDEEAGVMTYVDASDENTTLADGSPLNATGPDGVEGPSDDQWHWKTVGNGETVLTSTEGDPEDAPLIKTSLEIAEAGVYDVWVNFWGDPSADWRIEAGLTEDGMQIFRHMASQQVGDDAHASELILEQGGIYLYQAYLGRVNVQDGEVIEAFIDDEAVPTGQDPVTISTWYDGLSYAPVKLFKVNRSAIQLAAAENSSTIFEIQSSGVFWEATASEAWLSLDMTAGDGAAAISATATENAGATIREATITISSDDFDPHEIKVVQLPAAPDLSVSAESINFGAASDRSTAFEVTSNTWWSISSSVQWLQISPASGYNDGTVQITALENYDTEARIDVLTISAEGVEDRTLEVSQQGADPSLAVSTSLLEFEALNNDDVELDIMSNTDWTVAASASWIAVEPGSGSGAGAVVISVDHNGEAAERTATLTLSADGAAEQIVNIVQEAAEVTGIATSGDMAVFPNPVEDIVRIDLPGRAEVRLTTLEGKLAMSKKAAAGSLEINMKGYKPGVYLLLVVTPQKTVFHKLMKL